MMLSGGGLSDQDPLRYYGRAGQTVDPYFGGFPTVYNSGDVDFNLFVASDSAPFNGVTSWTFGDMADLNTCVWWFDGNPLLATEQRLITPVFTDTYYSFPTRFTFPTNYTGGTFFMRAVLYAEPIDG